MSAETVDPTITPDPKGPGTDSHGEGNGAPTGGTDGSTTVQSHGEGNKKPEPKPTP